MYKPNRKLYQPMVDVKILIEYTMTEEAYDSASFQEFLQMIRNGEMKKEMAEDGYFEKIKVSYKVQQNEENTSPRIF